MACLRIVLARRAIFLYPLSWESAAIYKFAVAKHRAVTSGWQWLCCWHRSAGIYVCCYIVAALKLHPWDLFAQFFSWTTSEKVPIVSMQFPSPSQARCTFRWHRGTRDFFLPGECQRCRVIPCRGSQFNQSQRSNLVGPPYTAIFKYWRCLQFQNMAAIDSCTFFNDRGVQFLFINIS